MMRASTLDRLTSGAPFLLAPLVVAAAGRGDVPVLEAVGFTALLVLWAAALAFAKARANARAFEMASRQEMEASLQRAVGMAESESDLLDIAGQAIAQVLPSSPAEILLADQTGNEIHLAAIAKAGAPGCPVDAASACPALRTGQTQLFARTDALDICPRLRARPGGPKPALCVPLAVMGRTIGVLHATTTDRRPFAAHQIVSVESVASHLGSRLRMLQMVDELQTQATTDSLTLLPNRRCFEERAVRALRRGSAVVAIADLDHFKKLNDTHGHAAGDRALQLFAESLRRSFAGKHDVVARLGGEEFALVVPRMAVDVVRQAFAQARKDLAAALDRQGGPRFTASFGVALAPEHGATIGELLAAADRALYVAKGEGRDRNVFVGDAPASTKFRNVEGTGRRISVVPSSMTIDDARLRGVA